jgi:hypothetical protein
VDIAVDAPLIGVNLINHENDRCQSPAGYNRKRQFLVELRQSNILRQRTLQKRLCKQFLQLGSRVRGAHERLAD